MKNKTISLNELENNLDLYIQKIQTKELDKIIIKNEIQDVVIIKIDEYERLKSLYDICKKLQ